MADMTWVVSTTDSIVTAIGTCAGGTDTFGSGANDGIPLGLLEAIDLVIEADASKTLNGTVAVAWYWQDPTTSRWARFPGFDESVSITAVRSVKLLGPSAGSGYPIISRLGRLAAAPGSAGIALSAGGVTLRLIGHRCRPGG